jgi:peptide/nickel transport system permease protein
LAPVDSTASFAFQAATSGGDVQEATEIANRLQGNTGPLTGRYVDWFTNFVQGNWGWSQSNSKPVIDVIVNSYPYSLQYAFPAGIISIILGYGIGLYSATNQYTIKDYAATFFAFFGISIPNFWFAIILVLLLGLVVPEVTLFGYKLLPLPVFYQTSEVLDHGWISWPNIRQLVIPVIVLSTAAMAGNMRYSRATALEYVRADFVKTARAKGASNWRVLLRHILRPAAVPLMTIFIGDVLALFLASSYLIEVVYQVPGLGLKGYQAIIAGDTPLVMGTTLIPLLIALLGTLLQDVAYTVLDPRIDYGDR